MKVLMYGWEFPPRISGGLGVACYAIVRSLEALGVDVKLVLPEFIHGCCCPVLRERQQLTDLLGQYQRQTASRPENGNHQGCAAAVFEECSSLGPYSGCGIGGIDSHCTILKRDHRWQQLLTEVEQLPLASSLRRFVTTKIIPLGMLGYVEGDSMVAAVLRYAIVAGALASQCEHQVIHAHDWLTILAALEGRSYSHKPVVMHVHALEVDRSGVDDQGIIYQIEQFGMQLADHIIAVSTLTKNNIVKYYGIEPGKISVVHNGVLPAVPQSRVLSKKCPMVLFLGRLTQQKGPYYFVEIARLVLKVLPQTQFVFAGTGDLLKSMIERVAALRLGSNIHFTGFLSPSQVQSIFGLADVYVMPSVSEPFGISALEAAQRGIPVIVSKQSGVTEVMPNVLRVDFWDSEKFADQVVALLRHQALARESVVNAARDLDKLTWERAVRRIIQIYQKAQ